MTDQGAWQAAVQACVNHFGRLDILVNNAGIGIPPVPIEEETVEGHHRILDVNLTGVWLGMRAVIPQMTAQHSGSIVNTSSIDGLAGTAGMASYAASKFAVTGLTRTTALEAGRHGIRVNSVHPGVIDTPMLDAAPAEVRAKLDRMMARQPIARTGHGPRGRAGRPVPRLGRSVVLHRGRAAGRRWPSGRPLSRGLRELR